ncbi:hypothetical protein [Mycobacteroides abscessus]|uniref:hypothetical protein n=1 Tax=Mycobacteroides abscessus TaxID=36809 RepID=UPI0009A58E3A|nr:hypothetical protein [Mycobacteroides abscessus]SKO15778.1 Uncharacterised protein [Mycobacteroides abscessus subsp. bolletii]SKX37175.1 Uncharacterised protein [Mycobacteroides abscessus subsp. bolletii]
MSVWDQGQSDDDVPQDFEAYRRRDIERTTLAEHAAGSVTRLVIEKDNVCCEFWADSWIVAIQDGGRTLKLFARGTGVEPATVAAQCFGEQGSTVRTVASSDMSINDALQRRFG